LGKAQLVDLEDLSLNCNAAPINRVAAYDDKVSIEGLGDANRGRSGRLEVDRQPEMIESILAVVPRDGQKSCGGQSLIQGVREGVADPGEVGLPGAVVERKHEHDSSSCFGGRRRSISLREPPDAAKEQKEEEPSVFMPPENLEMPCHT
jgi:hypothetical protein